MNGSTMQQKDVGLMIYPANPWMKALAKAPIVLWRMGLGPLLGRVFILITHTGRKSGLPRRTMTEYHVLNGRKYVPCAFGERAQWYKNIMADPHVTIQTADGTEHVIARRVTDDDELLAVYDLLRRRNPLMLNWYLESMGIEPTRDGLLAGKDRVYILTFEPTDEPTPPPLEADLTWVWWVLALLLARALRSRRCRR